jgi:hypothetical protein
MPNNDNAITVLRASLNPEQLALLDQGLAARTGAAAPAPAPTAASGTRSYTLDEVAAMAKALGMQQPGAVTGSSSPAPLPGPPNVVSAGPPVTSRGTPPPSYTITEDTPILSMSIPDREALRNKIGDIKFAERHLKELGERRVRVRSRVL